jgi:hypothetical protein
MRRLEAIMDRAEERMIEWDCAQTVQAFYAALDEKRYEDLANLFAAEGIWNRLGKDLIGPQAIVQAMDARSDWVTTHIVTNLKITVVSSNEAHTNQYVTLYRHEGVRANAGPLPVVLPLAILRHRDVLMPSSGTWKFMRKSSRAIMADQSRVTHYQPTEPARS